MFYVTWGGIIFVDILHRAKARRNTGVSE